MATTPLPFPQEPTGSVGPAAPLPTGTAVAHLTIERVLHEGLHAVVYLARDPSGQELALMEYFPRALALRQPDGSVRARQAGDAIALSVGREAFVLEANTLERIEHPGLVRVLGSLQAHRTVYRAMTFIDGPTLERHISAHGNAATAGAAVRLLDQLLDALDALHRAGVVHGCVRPDQILMAAGERPVLLGMGSASAEIAGHEAGPWSAPEQAAMSRHDRINSATDLYMAAATAWCYATGDSPPALRDRLAHPDDWDPAAALADLPEGADDAPGTRARLAAALSAALALLPAERPQRVADLRRLLHPGAASAPFEPAGTVPLWVGAMPDRDAQWEVFEKQVAYGRQPQAAEEAVPSEPATDVQARRPRVNADERPDAEAVPLKRPAIRWWWVLPVMALGGLAATGLWVMREDSRLPSMTVVADPPPPAVDLAASPSVATSSTAASMPTLAPTVEAPAAVVSPPTGMAAPATRTATPSPVPAAAPPVAVTVPPPPPALSAEAAAPREALGTPPARAPAPPPVAPVPKPRPAAPLSPRAACGNRSQFALLYCLQDQCSKPALRNHPQCNELRRAGDIQ